ncbi:CHC2 zinc finger domain-containing protein [Nitrolancea hollandica]|uniref:Zinc finger CHC2-type domain-containing protein n=1 Tax=Nitrolancea hollandica Lb TaxID=1129897 RepID=I4EK42_9BACT|nr:CHC2 zinc finger domain-containing protein [Nitrolancea hollandica]CCF85054.1 hypothetical protein NITHO_440004 [Nitrolancea hollandica Lb]
MSTGANPAVASDGASGRHQDIGDAANCTRPRRPFGCHLPDELRRAEWLYRYLKAQSDLEHADETRAVFDVWLADIAEERRFRVRHDLTMPGPAYTFPDGLIEDLRESIDLRQVADDDLCLTRRGRASMAVCPFHNDKTPSLAIYANGYKCFGCDAHGDVFDWLKIFRNIREFPEAVRYAAELAGRPLPERQVRKPRRKLSTRIEGGKVVVE